VTLNQSAAEILISLGVGEKVAGTGYEIDTVPAEIAQAYKAIPLLSGSGEFVSHEKLLEAQPDLVYSSFASFFSAAESGERGELHELGVPTYLTEFDCSLHKTASDASFEMLYQEHKDLGAIFDVPSAATKFIAEQKAVVKNGLATAEGAPLPNHRGHPRSDERYEVSLSDEVAGVLRIDVTAGIDRCPGRAWSSPAELPATTVNQENRNTAVINYFKPDLRSPTGPWSRPCSTIQEAICDRLVKPILVRMRWT
jgi:hypothetical protein